MTNQVDVASNSIISITVPCLSDVKSKTLDDLLPIVIEETLKNTFKEAGANAIYLYLEKKFQLDKDEILKKPLMFSTGLKALLGSAAPVIENLILKNLYQKLDLKFKKRKGYSFSKHIQELRR